MSSLFKNQPAKTSTPEHQRYEIEFEDWIDDFDPNAGWIVLTYGGSGAGKTWFAGTANNSIYLDTGGGTDTLKSPLFKSRYPSIRRKIKKFYETFEGGTIRRAVAFDQVTDAFDFYLEDAELRENFKTLILDDATSLRSFAKLRGIEIVDKIAGRTGDSKRQLNRYIQTFPDDTYREMDMIEWLFMQYIPIFRNEGVNLLMLAHERQIYGKAAKMMDDRPLKAIKPGFAGQTFPDTVPKHFDEVWYIKMSGNSSQIKTGGGGVELTKTRRAGVFPHFIIDPNYEELLQMRRENKLHPSFQKGK